MSSQLGPLISNFAGENRLLLNEGLTPNLAVDGQNVDYSRGTIRKRLGIPKTHAFAYPKGGMRITNATNNRALVILDQTYLDLAGDFTLEVDVRIESDPSGWSAAGRILVKVSGTSGWVLQYANASFVWNFQKADSAGGASFTSIAVAGNLSASTHPVVGETYHIAVWRTGTSLDMQVTRKSDGTTLGATAATCDGDTNNSLNVIVGAGAGATPSNQTIDITIDELRMFSDVRSTTEIDDCMFRELTDSEMSDQELIGYWRMNDSDNTTQCEDLSVNNNPAFLSSATCAYVPSIMPNPNSNNFALQGNGIDAYATAPYNSEYAPILNTSNNWILEFWARLDTAIEWPNNAVLCQLGSTTTGNGHVFSVYITWPGSGAAPLLKFSWSSTTTANNAEVTPATAFNPEPGVPFVVRLTRQGTSLGLRVNGTVISNTTVNSENGPTSDTSYGMTFLARNSAGTYSLLAPCTIDEVRLFTTSVYGVAYQNTEFPFVTDSTLVGYWRFNADDPLNDEAASSDAVLVPATEDKPSRTYGTAYPADPTGHLKLIGPVAVPVITTNTNQGQPLFSREFLVATQEAFFSQQGTTRNFLKTLDVPGSDSLYSWTRYLGALICCNGVGRNYIYNGKTVPASVTLPTDTDVPVLTATGAGSGGGFSAGAYTYRFTWYNQDFDIEGPYWGEDTETMAATNDSNEITSVPSSVSGYPSVTHWRVYRAAPSSTQFYRLATVAIGTTSYSDTNGGDISANTPLNDTRTHLDPQSICEVYNNRLFFARGSTLVFSDADTLDFDSTSVLFVNRDDGEAITGLKAQSGQLIVFKKTSIFVLDGDGPTTFQLRKLTSGVGCVSPHTVAASPEGVYFLGHDGVYVYRGNGVEYISHSQQPLFARIAHDLGHLAIATYHPETHQYYVSFDAFTEATVDISNPSREAIDHPELGDLFTHYYRCKTGADAVGTGGTISDADVAFVSDADRGAVLHTTGIWAASMTAQSAASSDFTFGFWRKHDSPDHGELTGDRIIDLMTSNQGSDLTFVDAPATYPTRASLRVFGSASVAEPVYMEATTWHQIVVAKTGTVWSIYVDGRSVATATSANPANVFESFGMFAGVYGRDVYIDNFFWIADLALTSEQINDLYMFETTEQVVEHHTMVFDEETKTWARHDKRFDYLTTAEYSSNSAEAIGGLNGFVCRIGESGGDLHISDGDTATVYTRTGSLSAVTGLKITDANATFSTVGNGHAGAQVVFVPTDTTKETQYRIILKNTATVLYLDAPLVESFTGTYYVGPIEMIWESPFFDSGSAGLVKVFQYIQIWQAETADGSFTVQYKTNHREDYVSITVPTDDEFVRAELYNRGRRIKLRIYDLTIDQITELTGIQLQYREAGVVV